MSQGIVLENNAEKASLEDTRLYQKYIGSLIYLMVQTRPDIAFAIGALARYMANPSKSHFTAIYKLWGYIKRTKNLGLLYKNKQSLSSYPRITGFCDSDWGGNRDTRRSTTGYLFLLGGTPISWASKLQKTVALSSCEAEYMALTEATKELYYLYSIYNELPLLKPSFNNLIYTDSQSAIELAKNPLYHPRTKHVAIKYHYIRESLLDKRINLVFTPTDQQLADSLTKPASIQSWPIFLDNLNLVYI